MLPIDELKNQILTKSCGGMVYQGFPRLYCPHLMGLTADGRVVIHAWQHGGYTSKGEISATNPAGWRFFYLDEVKNLTTFPPDAQGWYPKELAKSEADYVPPKFIIRVYAVIPC